MTQIGLREKRNLKKEERKGRRKEGGSPLVQDLLSTVALGLG